ncbi:hypothetical protein ZYGR_0E01460 [Zygosaccharomyces rouxii]|uniref:ZYRO0B03234p n=2 Tax=Zygosaccharomyces rouxii TaxID=4956 RepID=C5DQV2_ZYGRC|nr:uncharacterized protein ZYRO0B03234g [Zygosaccharomyces rouxii]KAH9200288.1 P-loop containing nucleoside triphosphate hydrolase protein [Zygosaccharomyces rouxii]GAV47131.1 hypothetical protein ZYGR_0E01460 [Zygosaccharomyces rouxii]CAR26163.1 ZYRO0B03234p [Zygosaccharomyces rouxii]
MLDQGSGSSWKDTGNGKGLSRPSSGHLSSPISSEPHQRHQIGSNIKVYVRCRSRNQREIDEKSSVVVSTMGRKGKSVILSNPSSPLSHPKKTYMFDEVFGADSDQESIFTEVAKNYIQEMLEGYNCTVFAYGQTGTGKTYTMSGDMSIWGDLDSQDKILLGEHAGIIPRVLVNLFKQLSKETTEHSVKISFLELYNERLKDLLADNDSDEDNIRIFDNNNSNAHGASNGMSQVKMNKSKVRAPTLSGATVSSSASNSSTSSSSSSSSITVKGMEERYIKSAYEGLQLLTKGSLKRKVAATKCNDLSSRSHTIFTIVTHVARTDPVSGEQYVKIGKLNLVDLAGSENINRSGAENMRAQEAGLINKSLLTLGRVINALVEHSSHIPYRGSKLTRLLQDSLGGKTKTCIIATISPARISMDETVSTLEYATRAKSIKNTPQVNQSLSKDSCIMEYIYEIERLRQELKASRQREGMYITQEQYDLYESNSLLVEEQKVVIQNMGEQIKRFKEKYVEQTKLSKEAHRQFQESQKVCDTLRIQKKFMLETFEKYHTTCKEHAAQIDQIHSDNISLIESLRVERNEMSTSALDNAGLISKILTTIAERSEQLTSLKADLEVRISDFERFSSSMLLDFERNALSRINHSRDDLLSLEITDSLEQIQAMHNSLNVTLQNIRKPWKKETEAIYYTHKNIIENCGNQLYEYVEKLENSLETIWNQLKKTSISEMGELRRYGDQYTDDALALVHKERERLQFLENELLKKSQALKESNEQLESLQSYFKHHLIKERDEILQETFKALRNSERRHKSLDDQMFEKSSVVLARTKEQMHTEYLSGVGGINRQSSDSLTSIDKSLQSFKKEYALLGQQKTEKLDQLVKYRSVKHSFQEFLDKLSKYCNERSSRNLLQLLKNLNSQISWGAESLGNEVKSIVSETRQKIQRSVERDESQLKAALLNLENLSNYISDVCREEAPQHFKEQANILSSHCNNVNSVISGLDGTNEYLSEVNKPKIKIDVDNKITRELPQLESPGDYNVYRNNNDLPKGETWQNEDPLTQNLVYSPSTPMPVPDQPLPKVLVPKSINSSAKRSHTLPIENKKNLTVGGFGPNNLKRRFTLEPPNRNDKENIGDSRTGKKICNSRNEI